MEFGVLGPLQVNGRGVVFPAKQRVLLAVLLLHANRVVSMQSLIDVVWDDAPPSSARVTLQGYVRRLRQNLGVQAGKQVITRPPGYLMVVGAGELDLDRFTGLCDRARSAADRGDWPGAARMFGDALSLWRGDPLADVPAAAVQLTEVPRLAELRMRAVESRVEADLRLGRHRELVAELRRLAHGEPLREGLHGHLMLALYRCGRQAEALEVFRGIDQRLRGELGISPGPELQQLHQRILTADPLLIDGQVSRLAAPLEHAGMSSAAVPPHEPLIGDLPVVPAQLPADTADFTGRQEQAKLLGDLLATSLGTDRPGAVVISAVAGMGGVGKTALAVHVAHRLRGRFPDGQLYVNLQGVTSPLRPSEVLARFLRDLGDLDAAIPAGEDERAARYRSLLAGRRVLVVLDDARDAGHVQPLLPGSAGCAVIVTSRAVLAGPAGAVQLSLEALGEEEARSLLVSIVGAERVAAEPEATSQVLASCAGLPLAVRIAGTRLASRPGWSIADLAGRLAGERGRLSLLKVGDLAVRASFAVSYDALVAGRAGGRDGAGRARVFRLMGLPRGMAVLSLPAIARLAGQPPEPVAAALEALTDAHLLQSPAPDRYLMHDLLRSYAAELAEVTDSQLEQDAAIGRILTWYAEQAVAASRLIAPALTFPVLIPADAAPSELMTDFGQALAWYEAELANLGAAVDLAAARGLPAIAAQIPMATRQFFLRTPHAEACVAMSEIGVRSARSLGDDAALNSVLMVLGWAYSLTGRPADADGCFAEALEIGRRVGDWIGETKALNSMAVSMTHQGRFDEAVVRLREALDILAAVGESRSLSAGLVQNNIGDALRLLNRFGEALPPLEQALAIHEEIGDPFSTSITEITLAEVYLGLGRYEDAIRLCQQALTVQQDIGRQSTARAEALCCLGDALAALGRGDEAREAWLTALPILDRLGDDQAAEVRSRLSGAAVPGGW